MEKLPKEIHELISDYLSPVEHLNYVKLVKTLKPIDEWHYSGRSIDCNETLLKEIKNPSLLSSKILLLLKNTKALEKGRLSEGFNRFNLWKFFFTKPSNFELLMLTS